MGATLAAFGRRLGSVGLSSLGEPSPARAGCGLHLADFRQYQPSAVQNALGGSGVFLKLPAPS
jgi:hypothetical protein